MVLVVAMMLLTAYSQFVIIPQMDNDRISAGGAIDVTPKTNPFHADFDRQHRLSTWVEEGVLLAGLATIVMLSRAETLAQADHK
jgi:hypothetical protein